MLKTRACWPAAYNLFLADKKLLFVCKKSTQIHFNDLRQGREDNFSQNFIT